MSTILIKHGTLVTLDDDYSLIRGSLLIENDRIVSIGASDTSADVIIDASDCAVVPGFVQTHVHLCQTLFRGAADDLSLIDWLRKRVWPMEATHTAESVAASARLGIAELIKGGTTTALTMETVNHTDEVFRAVQESGFRATVGKCMMDKGDEVPEALQEQTNQSIAESLKLLEQWHGAENGRIRYCFAPRFAVSCTRELLEKVGRLALEHGVMIHTHASENQIECQMVEAETGKRNVAYLDEVGLTGKHVALAHCVHLAQEEIDLLRQTGTNVAHCPSSNLKLGSGIAPIARLLASGVLVTLGADGAPCNNRLDMFTEMRTAALLQKALHGPEVLPAKQVLRMATIDGARALGLGADTGSLEVGKKADLSVIKLGGLHMSPRSEDVVSALVYAAETSDVQSVLVDGRLLLKDGKLLSLDEDKVIEQANVEAVKLLSRAGVKWN